MKWIKWAVCFLLVLTGVSIITFSVGIWLWSISEPTLKVFPAVPFRLNVESNTTYTVLLGALGNDSPPTHLESFNVTATWVHGDGKGPLMVDPDKGSTHIGSHDSKFGNVNAVSLATLTATASGEAEVNVTGGNRSGLVYVVDHGLWKFFFLVFGMGILNFVVAVTVFALIYRRSKRKLLPSAGFNFQSPLDASPDGERIEPPFQRGI